jgi:Ni/Fe-hydrogenase subunit HybB-like protein
MLLAGPKLHPLWHTPLLPGLFLLTCLAMGYSIVVFESVFSSMKFGRKPETRLLIVLQKLAVWGGVAFVVIRVADLIYRGRIGLMLTLDLYGVMFWLEMVLWLLPVVMMSAAHRQNLASLFRGAAIIAFAGALYRFDTFLVAFNPGPGWHYFPSVAEIFISVGIVSLELALYIALVKTFPILGGAPAAAAPAPVPALPKIEAPAPA